jgi:hypothetical protein
VWFRRQARFQYPIPPAPRTAVLSAVFRSQGAIRIFEDPAAIPAFEPQAIAGTLEQVESLVGRVNPTHAVIVFRRPSDPRLTDAERDRLWRAFGIPAFEQILAPDGSLYAWECEAHSGLHIESPRFDTAGHAVDATPCACGRSTTRLVAPAAAKARRAGSMI